MSKAVETVAKRRLGFVLGLVTAGALAIPAAGCGRTEEDRAAPSTTTSSSPSLRVQPARSLWVLEGSPGSTRVLRIDPSSGSVAATIETGIVVQGAVEATGGALAWGVERRGEERAVHRLLFVRIDEDTDAAWPPLEAGIPERLRVDAVTLAADGIWVAGEAFDREGEEKGIEAVRLDPQTSARTRVLDLDDTGASSPVAAWTAAGLVWVNWPATAGDDQHIVAIDPAAASVRLDVGYWDLGRMPYDSPFCDVVGLSGTKDLLVSFCEGDVSRVGFERLEAGRCAKGRCVTELRGFGDVGSFLSGPDSLWGSGYTVIARVDPRTAKVLGTTEVPDEAGAGCSRTDAERCDAFLSGVGVTRDAAWFLYTEQLSDFDQNDELVTLAASATLVRVDLRTGRIVQTVPLAQAPASSVSA